MPRKSSNNEDKENETMPRRRSRPPSEITTTTAGALEPRQTTNPQPSNTATTATDSTEPRASPPPTAATTTTETPFPGYTVLPTTKPFLRAPSKTTTTEVTNEGTEETAEPAVPIPDKYAHLPFTHTIYLPSSIWPIVIQSLQSLKSLKSFVVEDLFYQSVYCHELKLYKKQQEIHESGEGKWDLLRPWQLMIFMDWPGYAESEFALEERYRAGVGGRRFYDFDLEGKGPGLMGLGGVRRDVPEIVEEGDEEMREEEEKNDDGEENEGGEEVEKEGLNHQVEDEPSTEGVQQKEEHAKNSLVQEDTDLANAVSGMRL